MICRECGVSYQAPKERVNRGQGTFCTLDCYHKWYRKNVSPDFYGYEKGKKYFDGKRWTVRWYDANGKVHVTSYPRWWWENNVGAVQEGFAISYIDGDSSNIDPSNFECISTKSATGKAGKKLLGTKKSEESKKKMSESKMGRKLSDSHRENISREIKRRWEIGVYDNVLFKDIRGEKNPSWRGGVGSDYPEEFSKGLKKFIRSRDNHLCQICGCQTKNGKGSKGKIGQIHHISGDKNDNSYDNLILLCINCHAAVHHSKTTSPVILAFRSKLLWDK